MFEAGLITVDLHDNPVYSDIEEHFSLLLEYLSTKEEFEDRCKKFVHALRSSLGGSMEVVANKLESDWKMKVNNELHLDFNI